MTGKSGRFSLLAVALLASAATAATIAAVNCDGSTSVPSSPVNQPESGLYDPLAFAYSQPRRFDVANREAPVPPMCYTKTDGVCNPCWTCHTAQHFSNHAADWVLQAEYTFSDTALTNHWSNLFRDNTADIANIADAEAFAWIRQDNYSPLVAALKARSDFPGYVPDLDFSLGFDAEGFAADGSGWRAIRYKPFLGTFWPTNGSTDDVMIRLPPAFRTDLTGKPSRAVYKANLAILEASMCGDPLVDKLNTASLATPIEPVDENAAGIDLDGDGTLATATLIRGLPPTYAGGASGIPAARYDYPEGTEFLHTVRNVDPDVPSMISARMKEVRYMVKRIRFDDWGTARVYEKEHEAKDNGILPQFSGGVDTGLLSDFGWQLQGFIEDQQGRLRLQSYEEHLFCMGCHGNIGVTVNQTFSFPRKLPGTAGWRHQDIRGIPDVPQRGHSKPETLLYFERACGGDEFRANDEILEKFYLAPGQPNAQEILRAAPGGDRDLAHLLFPSRERAIALNKAYMVLVRRQNFDRGRDAVIRAPSNVHQVIENPDAGLEANGRVFSDGRLWLDWNWQPDE